MAMICVRCFDPFQLLFTKMPLKMIFVQHAYITAFSFKAIRYELDCSFLRRERSRGKRIKLGVILANLSGATEVFASLPVFKYLDRNKFEVFLYVYDMIENPIVQPDSTLADNFSVLSREVSDCVKTLRDDDLDLLFFGNSGLYGPSVSSVYGSFRLARKQFVHFCNPMTTGMRHMDYFVIGDLIDPENSASEYFSEQVLKLKGSGICFDMPPCAAAQRCQVTRDNFGISDRCTVFVSGANSSKIIPELRMIWAQIVAAVPESVLVLYPFGPAWGKKGYQVGPFINDMQRIFRQYGISRERLIILKPFGSRVDIIAFLTITDVYLDAVPYSGATSLLDPLEAGVPPVVVEGPELRFRQGSAILRELDMRELIARNEDEYIRIAVRLASTPDVRKAFGEKILRKMEQGPPFLDPRSYAKEIGRVLEEMVDD